MAINQSDALEQIQQILSGKRWTVEDLESIADVMRAAGYDIEDVPDDEDYPSPLVLSCTNGGN